MMFLEIRTGPLTVDIHGSGVAEATPTAGLSRSSCQFDQLPEIVGHELEPHLHAVACQTPEAYTAVSVAAL